MVKTRVPALFVLFFFIAGFSFAQELSDGFIRLILDEKQGSFSLYYLVNPRGRIYEPLFYTNDAATSFISVMVDDAAYRPSQSRQFLTRIETPHGQPSLVYESSFVLIRQIFTPVKTPNSNNINGVQITTIIQNKRDRSSFIGLRMLLDTSLGEERGRVPFITNTQLIKNETIINGRSGELYWISRGNNTALMGSIINPIDPNARRPDYLHFANWKRLHDTNWELNYREGRSFNYLPYSVGDSAVCYYYLPESVDAGGSITLSIVLTTDDPGFYEMDSNAVQAAVRSAAAPAPAAAPRGVQQEVLQAPVSPANSASAPPFVASIPEPVYAQEPPVYEPQVLAQEPVYVPEQVYAPEPVYAQEPPVYEPQVFEQEPVYVPEQVNASEPVYNTDLAAEYPHLNTAELRRLYELQNTLKRFIAGEIYIDENELLEIERIINNLKYGH